MFTTATRPMDVITKLRRPPNPWPNPELCIGRYICKIGSKRCWQAIGRARSEFLTLGTRIQHYLDTNSEPLPHVVTWSIYMIGKAPALSIPTIVFCCEMPSSRIAIRKLIKQSGLLDHHPGIKTGHMPRPPDFDQLVQLAMDRMRDEEPLRHLIESIVWDASSNDDGDNHVNSPIGQRVKINNHHSEEDESREATIGGVVQLGEKCYYMTAGHVFRAAVDFSSRRNSGMDQEHEFDDQTDSDDDSFGNEKEMGITSRGSFTPEHTRSNSKPCSGQLSLTSTSTTAESTHSAPEDTGPSCSEARFSLSQKLDNASEHHQHRNHSFKAPAPELVVTSYSGGRSDLDYAFLSIREPRHGVLNEITISGANLEIRNILACPQDCAIIALTSRGPRPGQLSGTSSFMRLPGSRCFQELFTIYLEDPLEVGDCGTWIVNAQSGDLFGHIIAGSPISGVAFIVPASQVFDDISQRLRIPLQLPTSTVLQLDTTKASQEPLQTSVVLAQKIRRRTPNVLDAARCKSLTDNFRQILSDRRQMLRASYRSNLMSSSDNPPSYGTAELPALALDRRREIEEGSPLPHAALRNTRNLSIIPTAPRDARSLRFRAMLLTMSSFPIRWENPELLDKALQVVPLQQIYDEAEAQSKMLQAEAESLVGKRAAWAYQDCVIRALMQWFKSSFFSWVNNPTCSACGNSTIGVGMAAARPDEQTRGASQVELYQCSVEDCSNFERFPRYNDPFVLIETRRGRVSEWSNCFGMLCRALGARARWIYNSQDHAWLEVYSAYRKRWISVDVCEQAWDQPHLYTRGWHRKLGYCIAFSEDGCMDVTKRYVRDLKDWGPRVRTSEAILAHILDEIRSLRRKDMSTEARFKLEGEDMREYRQLQLFVAKGVVAEICKIADFTNDQNRVDPNRQKDIEDSQKAGEARAEWEAERERLKGTRRPGS